jgi:hypothetical protein
MDRRSALVTAAVALVAVAGAVGLGLAACDSLPAVFECRAPADCVDGQSAGTCEPTGYCSFPDAACTESGRRYGTYAGDGLGGTCVGAVTDGGVGDGGVGDGGLYNFLPNPGCENGLYGWSEFQSALSITSTARSGYSSCQACLESGYTEFTFDDDDQGMSAVYSPNAGQVYQASAWVRSSPGIAPGQQVTLTLREWEAEGSTSTNHSISDPVTLTETWQYLEVTHTMAADAYALDMYVGNHDARPGDCFLVDDLAVYLLP